MAGQFSFGRDGNSTAHSPTLATLASMPEENRTVILTLKCTLSILDLSHFLFYQKVHHSSLCCSQAFIFFFCAHSVSCLAPYVAMENIQGQDGQPKSGYAAGYTSKSGQFFQEVFLYPLPFSFLLFLLFIELNSRKRMVLVLLASCHLSQVSFAILFPVTIIGKEV